MGRDSAEEPDSAESLVRGIGRKGLVRSGRGASASPSPFEKRTARGDVSADIVGGEMDRGRVGSQVYLMCGAQDRRPREAQSRLRAVLARLQRRDLAIRERERNLVLVNSQDLVYQGRDICSRDTLFSQRDYLRLEV